MYSVNDDMAFYRALTLPVNAGARAAIAHCTRRSRVTAANAARIFAVRAYALLCAITFLRRGLLPVGCTRFGGLTAGYSYTHTHATHYFLQHVPHAYTHVVYFYTRLHVVTHVPPRTHTRCTFYFTHTGYTFIYSDAHLPVYILPHLLCIYAIHYICCWCALLYCYCGHQLL